MTPGERFTKVLDDARYAGLLTEEELEALGVACGLLAAFDAQHVPESLRLTFEAKKQIMRRLLPEIGALEKEIRSRASEFFDL